MRKPVHLIGSIPLDNAESVMTTCCAVLGDRISRVPDEETGVRTNWIHWQRDLLGAHPAIHVVGEGRNADRIMPRFAVKRGRENYHNVAFASPDPNCSLLFRSYISKTDVTTFFRPNLLSIIVLWQIQDLSLTVCTVCCIQV